MQNNESNKGPIISKDAIIAIIVVIALIWIFAAIFSSIFSPDVAKSTFVDWVY